MNGVILSPDRPRCKITFDLIKMLGTCKHPAGKAKKGKKIKGKIHRSNR